MSLRLACIADDYTGASDLANTLSRNGLRTVQTIGIPADGLALPEIDAIVVAFKIRSVPAREAVAAALAAAEYCTARGAEHVMYKICSTFDSTDEGNIGPVTEALAARAGGHCVPVCPAFPETGRTVYQGHLFVGAVPLAESPLKDHPLNPMRDSNLVRVLARQSSRKVGLAPFDLVEQGEAAIAAALDAASGEGRAACIVDAIAERHLLALGKAALRRPVSTGASGLGLGLARAIAGPAAAAAAPDFSAPAGPAAIIAGSCSAATLGQIAAVEGRMPVRHLDAAALLAGDMSAALAWAGAHLGAGPVLLASSATPEAVAALKSAHGAAIGARIEAALATLAVGLAERGVRRLIVAGGETSGAIVDRLGIPAFEIGAEIAPGVPLLRSIEPAPRLFALKSGNFGGPDFFPRALAAMGVAPAPAAD
ncbi:MAG TPA: four-carbon acid sugar kinase family protein [Acidiphilium sp.]|nr:four-carbon acid sugar kinase family protein [Acidiphilium sp.]